MLHNCAFAGTYHKYKFKMRKSKGLGDETGHSGHNLSTKAAPLIIAAK